MIIDQYKFGGGIPRNGLISEWLFSGNANDTSGSGYNGTVTGANLTTDRKSAANSAYLFNGTSDYITFATGSNLTAIFNNEFTLSLWFYITAFNASQVFDYRDLASDGIRIYLSITPKIGFNHLTNLNETNFSLSLNTWVNLITVRTGDTYNFYFNNSLDAFSLVTSADINVTTNLRIGSRAFSTPAGFFPGKLDDIRLYNRALSANEITALANE